MRGIVLLVCLLVAVVFFTGLVLAQNLVIYPAKGQSQEQMEKDKFECYSWAKQQSGFDPMQAGSGTQPPPPSQPIGGERVRGAARGAAVGAVAGAIAGDAGKGAAAGAAGGAMIGGMQKRDKRRQQAEAQQQQSAAIAQQRSAYDRAFGACMEGRGYSVK
jgi:YMGG-like Gly-zipper